MHQAAGSSLSRLEACRGAGTVPAARCAGKPDMRACIRRGTACRGGGGGMPRFGAGTWLLALCLAAATAVPALAQEPAGAEPAPAAAQPALAAAEPAPVLEQVLVAGEYRYARSRRAGVFVSFDRGLTWQARSSGLPHRVVYPFPDPPEYAAITSLAADPANPRRLAATTASGVYLTTNGGVGWQRVATEQVHPHAYFTSVALSPHDPAGMLLGTSFHGIYETTDGGANWHHLKRAIRFLTDRSLFYEEVAGLSYDPAAPRAMVVLAGFDGGIFYVTDRLAEERDTPGTGLLRFTVPAMATIQVAVAPAGDSWELHAGTVDARWRLAADGSWAPIGAAEPLRRGVPLQPHDPAPAPAAVEPAPGTAAASPEAAEPATDSAATPPDASDTAATPPGAAEPASDTAAAPPAAGDSGQAAAPASDAETRALVADDSGQPDPPAAATGGDATTAAAGDTIQPAAADGTATSAIASAGEPGTPAADSGQAEAAAHEHSVGSVPGIAAGLPQVPAPECTTPAQPGDDGGAPQVAAGNAAAEQPNTEPDARQQAAALPATGQPAGADAATAAASPTPSGAADQVAALPSHPAGTRQNAGGQPSAVQLSAAAAAAGGAAEPDAHPCDDEHMLAAGEPGWITGPEGIGAAAPLPRAALRNGIYIRADRAVKALPEYLDLLARHGLDSIVIDFKTDDGRLTYDSELPLARAMGAAPGPIKLDRLIADAHAAGIYVIARLVVFKDPFLFDWDNHRLAIWDTAQAGPWRHLVPAGDDSGDKMVQREHWVDPFAPEVWQYNVAVAEELAVRGVDEIQFDYIRFPSDGPTERATYRHRRPGMRRVDAIESFLALARERLQVPISTDLFGFNSWYRAGNFIGQDIEVLSEYADVISPMFYPSHFPNHFLDDRSYTERAYAIYEAGVRRAQRMVRGRAFIRPYVQAFLIGRELRMEEEEYSRYLTRQLDGNRAAAGSGFTLWNASNRYYMVTEPLQPYFDTRREETP